MNKLQNLFITFLTMATLFAAASTLRAAQPSEEDHIGEISAQSLLQRYPEFRKEYESFTPNSQEIEAVKLLAGKEILALFGTWCHDSEREVPRLIKLIEAGGLPTSTLTLYAVNRQKKDPLGYYEKHELKYTPTIIVSEYGIEQARMVEKPRGGIASDLVEALP